MRALPHQAKPTGFRGGRYRLTALATLALGCGDDAARVEARSVSSCSAGWQAILTQPDGLEPVSLVLAQDALWFRTFEGSVGEPNGERAFIKSLSLGDGILRTLVQDEAELLWIEDGRLLYSRRVDSLLSVPLAGGDPALVLDAGGNAGGLQGFPTGLDASHFYWVDPLDPSDRNFSIWRMPRAGGDPERFASLAGFDSATHVWLGAEALIAAARGKSSLLSLDGSSVVELAEVAAPAVTPLGIDALGTYWLSSGAGESEPNLEIVRVPVTGAPPEVFWPNKPEGFIPGSVSPDGQGGWLVSGSETFDDGLERYELWFVDTAENGRLAACNPSAHGTAERSAPVFSSDAAYQVVVHGNEAQAWSIVKAARE